MTHQRRFEDALKKLQADLDMKLAQRDELKEQQRLKKVGMVVEDGDTEGGNEGDGDGDEGLFGDEGEIEMQIG